jgi:hypothetical protein
MGWTQFTMHEPIKSWFKNQWETSGSDYEVLDSALVQRTTLYGAIRQKSTGDVFCAVYMIRWNKAYHYNFSYKDMTEHSGPYCHDCPPKIFNLLTPLSDNNDENGWAREWRGRVQKAYDTKKVIKSGVVFKTTKPVSFVNGEFQYFRRLNDADGHLYKGAFKRNGNNYVPYEKTEHGFRILTNPSFVSFDPLKYNIEVENLEVN